MSNVNALYAPFGREANEGARHSKVRGTDVDARHALTQPSLFARPLEASRSLSDFNNAL